MITKELNYPYILGRGGIPFDEITTRVKNGEQMGSFYGGSGKLLEFNFYNERFMEIVDPQNSRFDLMAEIDDSGKTIDFRLNTKIKGQHHPDFYAKKFVGFALKFFESNGNRIEICQSRLYNERKGFESDTYTVFKNEYKKRGDKVAAAKATWSGKTFALYGFTEITEDDVVLNPKAKEGPNVIAFFHKQHF